MDSRLYAIHTTEEVIKPKEPKMYSLYGEFRQGSLKLVNLINSFVYLSYE